MVAGSDRFRRGEMGYLERLLALQRVNPNVRNAEIEAWRQQARELADHFDHARPRLDAVQLIVTL